MKERPILLSAPMVSAILAGTKTQTRRVVADQWLYHLDEPGERERLLQNCRYGQPGDRLWVRETWNWFDPAELHASRRGARAPFTGCQGARQIEWVAAYAADGPLSHVKDGARALWRPSIHMPRWASRIDLDVTAVRVERLQDISRGDAMAEGCPFPNIAQGHDPRQWYADLWKQIYDASSWDANPWVWVIEFERRKP